MIENSLYDNYTIDFSTTFRTDKESYYFIFNSKREIYYPNDIIELSTMSKLSCFTVDYILHIGTYKNHNVFVVTVEDESESFISLHDLYNVNKDDYQMATRAILVVEWYISNQFCGRCGTKNEIDKKDMMMLCPNCGQVHYSRIAPAIIVAINNNGKLLMAKHSYYSRKGFAILAGFVECGESLEEAVKREVKEEVGINIKNVKYVKSQSWPFPNSLMLGFTADYESGDIKVDNNEILEAKWFDKEDIPSYDSDISISSWLINNFINTH